VTCQFLKLNNYWTRGRIFFCTYIYIYIYTYHNTMWNFLLKSSFKYDILQVFSLNSFVSNCYLAQRSLHLANSCWGDFNTPQHKLVLSQGCWQKVFLTCWPPCNQAHIKDLPKVRVIPEASIIKSLLRVAGRQRLRSYLATKYPITVNKPQHWESQQNSHHPRKKQEPVMVEKRITSRSSPLK
jgi:hypothetical protein